MKKFVALFVCAAVISSMTASQADALPAFAKGFAAYYASNTKVVAAAKEAKCNVCHYGKSKKNRNDYGKALSKHVTKADYKELKDQAEALKAKMDGAFKAVEGEKNAAGKTYGELLKAGSLPGTNPEG